MLTWQNGLWRAEEHAAGWLLFEAAGDRWGLRLGPVPLGQVGDWLIRQGVHPVDDLD